jgi:hypothetical protein
LLSCSPTFHVDCPATELPGGLLELGGLTLERRAPLGGVCGPAYAELADLDRDGAPELIVAGYGKTDDAMSVPPGAIQAFDLADLDAPPRALLSPDAGLRFPHRPRPHDVDGDGDVDLIVGLGFFPCTFVPFGAPCGGLVILDNDGQGVLSPRELVAPGAPRFFHGVDLGDLDGDGLVDLVSVAERRDAPWSASSAEAVVFAGVPGGFDDEPRVLAAGLGPFPQVIDVDGDGDLDVAGASFFGDHTGFSWLENEGGAFTRHDIDPDAGPSIQLRLVPDLLGDGALAAIGSNHVNPVRAPDGPDARLTLYRAPAGAEALRSPWPSEVLLDGFTPEDRAGQLSPGIFSVGDVDGDGRLDVLLSGDGDPRVFLLLQREAGRFDVELIADDLPQAGGALIADLDRDGDKDLVVTSYEHDAIVIFENTGPRS